MIFGTPGQILNSFRDPEAQMHMFSKIHERVTTFVEWNLDLVKQIQNQNKKTSFLIRILSALKKILQSPQDPKVRTCLLRGKFFKALFPESLSHSVIIGWDGGIYTLLNSLTEEEIQMIKEDGEISQEYMDFLKKKSGSAGSSAQLSQRLL